MSVFALLLTQELFAAGLLDKAASFSLVPQSIFSVGSSRFQYAEGLRYQHFWILIVLNVTESDKGLKVMIGREPPEEGFHHDARWRSSTRSMAASNLST